MDNRIAKFIKQILPSPFSIAIILTIVIIVTALLFTDKKITEIVSFWEKGLWNPPLMNFAMQMMLMLVLGYVIALSQASEKLIEKITILCHNTSTAAFLVSASTIIMSLLNWGLGLVFGAILARKVGEHALKNNIDLNYPLIGAAGYSGLMVWHGGLSGSIPLKVSEINHFSDIIINENLLKKLPENGISFESTIFSSMNITVTILLLTIIPLTLFYVGKKNPKGHKFRFEKSAKENNVSKKIFGAEKIDYSYLFSKLIGISILCIAFYQALSANTWSFINPNFVNLSLFGCAICVHRNIKEFLLAVNKAITSATGILIQFPLYFGIMGIMNSSGLVDIFANIFVSISTVNTYPIFTMISGG